MIETPLPHLGDTAAEPPRSYTERRRARNLGITYLVLAAVVAIFFTRHTGDAVFKLDGGRSFTLGSQTTAWFTVAVFAVLAGIQLARGFGKLWTA